MLNIIGGKVRGKKFLASGLQIFTLCIVKEENDREGIKNRFSNHLNFFLITVTSDKWLVIKSYVFCN